MKTTHPAFWGAGLAGLFIGVLLVVMGATAPSDAGRLAGGYGLLVLGSAAYLLAGLTLRERLARRSGSATHSAQSAAAPAAGRS
jgi:hypothetical protein